jgi:hypothetical protein
MGGHPFFSHLRGRGTTQGVEDPGRQASRSLRQYTRGRTAVARAAPS